MIMDIIPMRSVSSTKQTNCKRYGVIRRILPVACSMVAFCALGIAPARAAEERTFDRTLNVGTSPSLNVATGAGYVHLHPGSDNQIHVIGHVHSSHGWMTRVVGDVDSRIQQIANNPPIVQNGNEITVGERHSNDIFRHIDVDYDITLPSASAIVASSGSGDLDIQDVGITLKADTGSGSVRARGIHGSAKLETGSGDIEFSQTAPGDVKAQTGSGAIRLSGISGGLNAETGSGDIEISGNPRSDWKLDTGSGSIHLNLGTARFNVNASTGSGSIHIEQPSIMQAGSDKHDVHASVNGGGPAIKVETGSGDIVIR